jgi:uncharacterized protein YndB with AHSA1/START domain
VTARERCHHCLVVEGRDEVDLSEMSVAVTHRFDARIEDVWDLLSDVERMAGLGPEHVEARWVERGPHVGASFMGKNRREDFEWEVPCYITECDRPTRVAWTVLEPENPSSLWSYTLAPDGEGTSVTQRFQHGPNYSFIRLWAEEQPDRAAEIVRDRAEMLRADMATTLTNAARLLSKPAR